MKKSVIGYMDGVDYECELGQAKGGNSVFASVEDCEVVILCTDECGIVEVEVVFRKWVNPQDLTKRE